MSLAIPQERPRSAGAAARRQPVRIPVSTYRLQLHTNFTFAHVTAIVPYLAKLGVSDCYTSPYLMARPGSTHGYDVTNHTRLNPELGSEADYATMTATLREHGLGHIFDFVPNHMGIDPQMNPWWRDALENGQRSPFARYFDIDWQGVKPELRGKVLLPILGDQYGHVLDRGELRLEYDAGTFSLRYGQHRLPINPRHATRILRHNLDALGRDMGEDSLKLHEFLEAMTQLESLPADLESDPTRITERQRDKEAACARLQRLVESVPRLQRHVAEAVVFFNGEPGRPDSFEPLHALLEMQAYRLAYWRTASHEINYRRFFDINDLAGIRVEDPNVFEATHRLVAQLLAERKITGLRIDHPDGLFDPHGYFERVQALARRTGAVPVDEGPAPLYLVAEKILSAGEALPDGWPVHGTTGYNFLNDLNGLFVAAAEAPRLRKIYTTFAGRPEPFVQVLYESKKLIMETSMASELHVLAHALNRISERDRHSRDFTLDSLHDALREVVACFPVYRTYVSQSGWTDLDRQTIEVAIRRARQRNPVTEPEIYDFVRAVLLPERPPDSAGSAISPYAPPDEEEHQRRLRFAMQLQQYTGPVQAKGLEDTACYRYNLLLSLNEVGGNPSIVGRSPAEFHAAALERLRRWRFEMLTTATHDTKLGEDVRTRLDALSELPDHWRAGLARWARLNEPNHTVVDGEPAPDRNDEYRLYQALLGAWPAELQGVSSRGLVLPESFVARIREYMIKSIREAKEHTSWINNNRAYDDATAAFVDRTLAGPRTSRFLFAFLPLQQMIARIGMVNSLSQVVVKASAPGVPDFYRGTELWDLSLVDPDNRRPVDFERRLRVLEELEPLLPAGPGTNSRPAPDRSGRLSELLARWPDGRIKLFVTASCLRVRRSDPDLFLWGDYVPLDEDLTVTAGILAFARRRQGRVVLVVAPRLVARITSNDHPFPLGTRSWKTSRILLPPDLAVLRYRNIFTGEELRAVRHKDMAWLFVSDALQSWPVAVLTGTL